MNQFLIMVCLETNPLSILFFKFANLANKSFGPRFRNAKKKRFNVLTPILGIRCENSFHFV